MISAKKVTATLKILAVTPERLEKHFRFGQCPQSDRAGYRQHSSSSLTRRCLQHTFPEKFRVPNV